MTDRLDQARAAMSELGVDALLVGPSTDLRWLVGYNAMPMERLTLLVLPASGPATLVVPGLEEPRAAASSAPAHASIRTWEEVEDPFALVAEVAEASGLPADATFAVQDQLWASFLLRLQGAFPEATWRPGSDVLRRVRSIKTPDEVAALMTVGAAIDAVHAKVPSLLRVGRTEAEVGADIAELILEDHDKVEFIIVASGPNGASPHHETSDRVLQDGDAIVVDIGGRKAGYCSDMTRNYVIGTAPEGYAEMYPSLIRSQQAGVDAGRPGVAAQEVDRAARAVLVEAGYGPWFNHRTGHGIGVDVHEHPYMVEGNDELLATGMAYSVEPGVYLPGKWGARIEDIVVLGDEGAVRCNNLAPDYVVVDGKGNRL